MTSRESATRLIAASVAAMLTAAAFTACAEEAPKPEANPHPMSRADHELAVAAMNDVAADLAESPGPGRLVGAVKPEKAVFLITSTSTGNDEDLCLQARISGTGQTAFLEPDRTVPRTELPTAKACAWFLHHPDAAPGNTEIVDFGAGDLVFGNDDSKPWSKELARVRDEMSRIVSDSLQPYLDEHPDGRGYTVPEGNRAVYTVGFTGGHACLKGTLPDGKALHWLSATDDFIRPGEPPNDEACRGLGLAELSPMS